MEKRIRVLFLPRWYPHRYDPMPGLFVSQLAESLAETCDVAVLYAHADDSLAVPREIDISVDNGVHTVRVYYKNGPLKILSFWAAYREGFRVLRTFNPDLIHVHVLTRHGFLALIQKISFRTPYVITEHWSRYFKENGSYRGFVRKWATKLVVRQAGGVMAVSGQLKNAMIRHGLNNKNFRVIPNSVDFQRFVPADDANKPVRKRIIHVSCFDDKPKNISGFLRVLSRLSLVRDDFECSLIGEGPDLDSMKTTAERLFPEGNVVRFEGLLDGDNLVKAMNQADFLVLSSNYETFGTVIVESLACGVPVVSTDVGIASAIINPSNGFIVPPADEDALLGAISEMLDKCRDYDKSKLKSDVMNNFDKTVVAGRVWEMYLAVLK